MLFTVDLIFHKEMALLFQVGATVGAHVTLGVAVTVPQFHKHTAAGGRKESGSVSDEHTEAAWGPGLLSRSPSKSRSGSPNWPLIRGIQGH